MVFSPTFSITAMVLFIGMGIMAATVFEDVPVVTLPKRDHGYRGMNGDLIQLLDGSLLYCYTSDGIVVRKPEPKVACKASQPWTGGRNPVWG